MSKQKCLWLEAVSPSLLQVIHCSAIDGGMRRNHLKYKSQHVLCAPNYSPTSFSFRVNPKWTVAPTAWQGLYLSLYRHALISCPGPPAFLLPSVMASSLFLEDGNWDQGLCCPASSKLLPQISVWFMSTPLSDFAHLLNKTCLDHFIKNRNPPVFHIHNPYLPALIYFFPTSLSLIDMICYLYVFL